MVVPKNITTSHSAGRSTTLQLIAYVKEGKILMNFKVLERYIKASKLMDEIPTFKELNEFNNLVKKKEGLKNEKI